MSMHQDQASSPQQYQREDAGQLTDGMRLGESKGVMGLLKLDPSFQY